MQNGTRLGRAREQGLFLLVMPRGMVRVEECFLGFNSNNSLSLSLSLLPCQSVTPSHDPRRIRICVSFSLYHSFSLYKDNINKQQQQQLSPFSLSIYSFVCPFSLSPRISRSSSLHPCPNTPLPSLCIPTSPISCNPSSYCCLIHQHDWYAW